MPSGDLVTESRRRCEPARGRRRMDPRAPSGLVRGQRHASLKTGGTAEGPTFRPGWTVGHIAGATQTVHQVAPSSPDIAHATLTVVARGESLSREQARTFMAAVLDGDVTPAQ